MLRLLGGISCTRPATSAPVSQCSDIRALRRSCRSGSVSSKTNFLCQLTLPLDHTYSQVWLISFGCPCLWQISHVWFLNLNFLVFFRAFAFGRSTLNILESNLKVLAFGSFCSHTSNWVFQSPLFWQIWSHSSNWISRQSLVFRQIYSSLFYLNFSRSPWFWQICSHSPH